MQVGVTDPDELIERNIHHFVIQKLLAERFCPDAKISLGCRKQFVLKIALEFLESAHHGAIGALELCPKVLLSRTRSLCSAIRPRSHAIALYPLERLWHVLFKELDNVRH